MFDFIRNKVVIAGAAVVVVVLIVVGVFLFTGKSSNTASTSKTIATAPTNGGSGAVAATTTTAVPNLNPTGACKPAVAALDSFIKAHPASMGSPSGAELSAYLPIFQNVLKNCPIDQRSAVIGHVVNPWLAAAAKVSSTNTVPTSTVPTTVAKG